MNIRAAGGILIVGGLLAVTPLSSRSLAQTNDANVSAPQSGCSKYHQGNTKTPLLALSRRNASALWQPESPHIATGRVQRHMTIDVI